MKSFLLMGQSNMAGRGWIADVEPIRNKKTSVLRNGHWQPLCEPINIDRIIHTDNRLSTFSGVGPGASFADAYANYYDEQVGLIPAADGGRSLEEWRVDGQLFLNAFYQAKLAMNVSELAGILWHQGEAESSSEQLSHSYKPRFLTIMNELQARLGVNVPIIVGELGYFLDDYPKPIRYWRDTNKQLNELAAENDNIAIASAEGLSHRGDNLHFDAAAQREFGRRYFEAYRTLREGK